MTQVFIMSCNSVFDIVMVTLKSLQMQQCDCISTQRSQSQSISHNLVFIGIEPVALFFMGNFFYAQGTTFVHGCVGHHYKSHYNLLGQTTDCWWVICNVYAKHGKEYRVSIFVIPFGLKFGLLNHRRGCLVA